MVESLAAAKFRRLLGIGLIFLTTHAMNGESAALPTGIEGTVMVGPIHGGPARRGEPDSAPMKNVDFIVETAAGTIKTFTTDENGHFKVELPPGRYSIRAQRAMMKGRGCGLSDIDVAATGFKQVNLHCDTGMR